jgi:hypothetical protein
LFWRDPIKCLESLFTNPLFHNKLDFVRCHVYKTASHLMWVYSEWMMGNIAWEMQVCAVFVFFRKQNLNIPLVDSASQRCYNSWHCTVICHPTKPWLVLESLIHFFWDLPTYAWVLTQTFIKSFPPYGVRNHNSVGMKRPYLHELSIDHLYYGVMWHCPAWHTKGARFPAPMPSHACV